jgi:hypothetical protein
VYPKSGAQIQRDQAGSNLDAQCIQIRFAQHYGVIEPSGHPQLDGRKVRSVVIARGCRVEFSNLAIEGQAQARARPACMEEFPGRGAGDVCITHVGAAEADVGGDRIGAGEVFVGAIR